jgi:uncharacterized Fe-S cluster-containing radical SAM superfamily protein
VASGGDAALIGFHAELAEVLRQRPNAVVIRSVEGAIEQTYESLIASLG